MAGTFDPNAIFNFDNMDANFDMDPNVFGEEVTEANQGTTSQFGEEAVGDASIGNPINHGNNPFVSLGTPMTNNNYDLSLPINEDKNPLAVAAHATDGNFDPVQGQIQHQKVFQESVGFNQDAGSRPKPARSRQMLPTLRKKTGSSLPMLRRTKGMVIDVHNKSWV